MIWVTAIGFKLTKNLLTLLQSFQVMINGYMLTLIEHSMKCQLEKQLLTGY